MAGRPAGQQAAGQSAGESAGQSVEHPAKGAAAPERPRRRDAERNAAAIVDAGLTCLLADPQAGMAAIARAAGVSRVTLYAHFPTRESLLEAALDRSVAEAVDAVAGTTDSGPADEALAGLIRSSWQVLDRHASLFTAVSASLTPDQMRERHERILAPVHRLVLRGRRDGVFRDDVPATWLVTVLYSLVHAAAAEMQAGRLSSREAPDLLVTTVLATWRPQPA
ncbi:TetR/AcrR family transcriptional regulator [Streptodolium elevatio]|uniref:TetR/AcrR family transcriptional regulator n=1 Tax=Streptodolium elevatio TaxID=3157996 RepID=A0ABV3DFH9_9ACTN